MRQLLVAIPFEADAVVNRLKAIMDDQEKQMKRPAPRAIKRSGEFYARFCDVVSRTAGPVHTLLSQGMEYTLPFGLLMLLFKVRASCLLWPVVRPAC